MVNSYDIAILSEKVARLEALLAAGGVALPEVTSDDNGKTLQVVAGDWATGAKIPGVVNALNSTSETDALSAAQGKVLNDSKVAIKTKDLSFTFTANGLYAMHNDTDISDPDKVLKVLVKNSANTYGILLTTYSTGRYALLFDSSNMSIITTAPTLDVVVHYYE